ncbi:MAG: metal ABC transporter substrate-binding protein [Candidatus Krumholzibacteriota bacterium]
MLNIDNFRSAGRPVVIRIGMFLAMMVFGAGLVLPGPAQAKVKVVATLADLGWIAEQVGGDDVEVEFLCKGHRDPHVLPAKPSLARRMKKADLLVYNGLELEIGWLPLLLDAARNPRIRPGQQGELNCALALGEGGILEVPVGEVDRSQGDIHPLGNPHYLLDPRNGIAVGHLIAERLAVLDPAAADRYRQRADQLARRIEERQKDWETRIGGLGIRKLIVYHQHWEYFAAWMDLEIIGVIENRPGISPAPRHVEGLIELGRQHNPVLVIAATWNHIEAAAHVAGKIGAELAVLPGSTLAVEEATGYLELFEVICRNLETAGAARPKADS